jgi:hypothetical protein
MKQSVFLFAAVLLLAASAGAQATPDNSLPAAPVALAAPVANVPGEPSLFALAGTPALATASRAGAAVSSAPGSASTDQEQPTVYGVIKNYNWQVNGGFTFLRLYVVPHVTENMAGLNIGAVYYPGGKWIGAEGEFTGTFGSLLGISSKYVQGMGGARFRWAAPRGLEIWGHGMIGGSKLLPQTAFGNQASFAYEVGGGVDINPHQRRFAYRFGADMVGTHFFSTYQYSPKVYAALVYKF